MTPRTQPQPLPNHQTYDDYRNGVKVRATGRSPLRSLFWNQPEPFGPRTKKKG